MSGPKSTLPRRTFPKSLALPLTLTLTALIVPTGLFGSDGAQCLPQCPSGKVGLCEDFSERDLGELLVVHGQPLSGEPGCRLQLQCTGTSKSEIQSSSEMLFGTLHMAGVFHTAWAQAPSTAVDSYLGWQIFIGDCHSAIVIDDGTLAILYEDPAGNCVGDPSLQCYLPIPGWAALASSPRNYELTWDAQKVVLSIDGVERVTASEATCGFPPPALPMRVDLNCNLDGALTGDHVLEVDALAAYRCTPGPTQLCLNSGRFVVETEWRTTQGVSGTGRAAPLTRDTGYFWFFDDDNVEEVVKVLNGCGLNDRFWVFAGGLTDVEVTTLVTDTVTGVAKQYRNALGSPFQPLQATDALAACPSLEGPYRVALDVPARPEDPRVDVLTPAYHLRVDSRITLSASGFWNLGFGRIGPNGDPARSCDGCPASGALGALIGRIGTGPAFLIGSGRTFIADRDGVLFLGSNDNAVGTCSGGPGSCYEDNQGSLRVTVTVE